MADNNKDSMPPDWVQDCNRITTNWLQGNKEAWVKSTSITFDPIAQSNLPIDVQAKIDADRFTMESNYKELILEIEKVLSNYRDQEDFSNYRLAAYLVKKCKEGLK